MQVTEELLQVAISTIIIEHHMWKAYLFLS